MRTIKGKIVLPENAPKTVAELILIEVRDVSVMDAPSVVMAQQQLKKVEIAPHQEVAFKVSVPEVEASRTLSLRVHVNLAGGGTVQSGDLLTVQNYYVSSVGAQNAISVSVEMI